MILDATAGNRTMYRTKNTEHIIYIDIEKKLEVKPTIFASNINTPFLDNTFATIIFDPPHGFGKGHPYYKYPDAKSFTEAWKGYGKIPRYYGWDKLRSGSHLTRYLYDAQKEFQRILKDDGLLWLKWNEVTMERYRIMPIFNDWDELLRIHQSLEETTAGKQRTYWICLCKKRGNERQVHLA